MMMIRFLGIILGALLFPLEKLFEGIQQITAREISLIVIVVEGGDSDCRLG